MAVDLCIIDYEKGSDTDSFDEGTKNSFTKNYNICIWWRFKEFSYRAPVIVILQDGIVIGSVLIIILEEFKLHKKLLMITLP